MHGIAPSRIVHVYDEQKTSCPCPSQHWMVLLLIPNLRLPFNAFLVVEDLVYLLSCYPSFRVITLNVAPVELVPDNWTAVHTESIYTRVEVAILVG